MTRSLSFIGAIIMMSLTAIACTTIEPGNVGIKISKTGDNKGVLKDPVLLGWQPYNPLTEEVFEYPINVQNVVWSIKMTEGNPKDESIAFTNKDGLQISVDVNLAYHLESDKVPAFWVKFKTDRLSAFNDGFLHSAARDAFNEQAGKYAVEDIMGNNGKFLAEVRQDLQSRLEPLGVHIDQFGLIDAPRPPKQIIQAINDKMAAVQLSAQKTYELVSTKAEADKEVARANGHALAVIATATAEAEANRKLSESLTPGLIEYNRTLKWNGTLPQVTGGATPLLSLK